MARCSVIAGADDSYTAIVAGNIFDEPRNCVIGVGALIGDLRIGVIDDLAAQLELPSDLNRPRMSSSTKMYCARASSDRRL